MYRLSLVFVALRKESVDRNPGTNTILSITALSLSARRAWIEIACEMRCFCVCVVALRKESVDRNLWWGVRKAVGSLVALRKESVDRNCRYSACCVGLLVALRKESVDRNSL